MRLMPSSLALRSSRDRRQQGPDGQNLIEPLGSNCIQEGQGRVMQTISSSPREGAVHLGSHTPTAVAITTRFGRIPQDASAYRRRALLSPRLVLITGRRAVG
jgi:hypothetical protein